MPTNSASCCLGNAFRNPATCPCSSPTIATRTATPSCGAANAAEQHNIKRPATVRRERRNAMGCLLSCPTRPYANAAWIEYNAFARCPNYSQLATTAAHGPQVMAASQELRITALSTMSVFPTIEIVFCACYLFVFFEDGDLKNGEKSGREGRSQSPSRITSHKSRAVAFPPVTIHAFLIASLPIRNQRKSSAINENGNSNRQKRGIF